MQGYFGKNRGFSGQYLFYKSNKKGRKYLPFTCKKI